MSVGLQLLGAIIDTSGAHILREISRDWFIGEEIRLYDFMSSHYRRYGNLPAIDTVEEELEIRLPEAEEVVSYYVHRVRERKVFTELKRPFGELKDALQHKEIPRALDIVADMHAASRAVHTRTNIQNFREALDGVVREYEFAHNNPGLSGVPTNWPTFDTLTGGCQPGDLITLVARPGQGKTYYLLRMAHAAWQMGFGVLIVTQEMTIVQITRRLAALEAGLNPSYLRKGTLSRYAYRRLMRCIDNLAGADRLRLFSGGLHRTPADVELLFQEFRPDCGYIDGVYLMHPNGGKALPKIERVGAVFDDLKQLTLSQERPLVVTTQFNRQSGSKGQSGSLETIAYTDTVSTHSSIVAAIGDVKGDPTRKQISFLKGREGEWGSFETNFKFSPVDFSEAERDMEDGEGTPVSTGRSRTASNLDYMR